MTMLMKVANEQWCNSNKKDLPCYACSLSFECAFCPFFCPGSEGTFSCTCVCLAFFVLCFGFVRVVVTKTPTLDSILPPLKCSFE
jgi:hypothetical protein